MWMGYPALCTIIWPVVVRRGDKASCQVLHCPIVQQWVVAPFRGGAKPLGLDIRWSVDHLVTCVTESYIE
jgi:hypothetical protein